MPDTIEETFALLSHKDNKVAYAALKTLQAESERSPVVYSFMDRLGEMLDSDNSYLRTRALTLLAYNARWDTDYKIDEIIDCYLKHITDPRPITARQCIQLLPMLAKDKPDLKDAILAALHQANITVYADSMQPLIYKDIQNALAEIKELPANTGAEAGGTTSG